MKQIFIKLIFLYKYIMDKEVQYILLVFIGLWFVCCFLRFTSSIIFSKIIPVIFALCMIVFSVIALISFQWLYWMNVADHVMGNSYNRRYLHASG